MSDANLQSRARHLLALAKNIRHYEEALALARGERFNLFDVLHVGHYEVRTHSPMLAELLNPQGSHGQGAVFLQNFLAVLEIDDFDAELARVTLEVSIGDLGRVDIEITDRKGRRLLIENKIYAGLQERQLERYHQHDPKANLLFLTLNGDCPADGTDKTTVPNLQLVSYREDIVRWLECCRKEVATVPCVREAITQYIQLIQRLTQQNTSAHMNRELIAEVLKTRDTYLAYAALRNANGEIRKAIIAKVNEQLNALGKELGLNPLETFAAQGAAGENYFYTTGAMKAQNLKFGLRCADTGYRNFSFGFAYLDWKIPSPPGCPVVGLLKGAFSEQFSQNEFWHAYAWWGHRRNWDDETMAAILSGEFAPELKGLVEKLASVASKASKSSAAANPLSNIS